MFGIGTPACTSRGGSTTDKGIERWHCPPCENVHKADTRPLLDRSEMDLSACARSAASTVRLPHRLLLRLCCCRMFAQYFLHLRVGGHVLVHAAVDTRGLTNAELGLFVHGDTLAKALLRHPVRASRQRGSGGVGGVGGVGGWWAVLCAWGRQKGRGIKLSQSCGTYLLNMSVIASSSFWGTEARKRRTRELSTALVDTRAGRGAEHTA